MSRIKRPRPHVHLREFTKAGDWRIVRTHEDGDALVRWLYQERRAGRLAGLFETRDCFKWACAPGSDN